MTSTVHLHVHCMCRIWTIPTLYMHVPVYSMHIVVGHLDSSCKHPVAPPPVKCMFLLLCIKYIGNWTCSTLHPRPRTLHPIPPTQLFNSSPSTTQDNAFYQSKNSQLIWTCKCTCYTQGLTVLTDIPWQVLQHFDWFWPLYVVTEGLKAKLEVHLWVPKRKHVWKLTRTFCIITSPLFYFSFVVLIETLYIVLILSPLFYCSSQMQRILAEDVLITSLISSYFSSVVLIETLYIVLILSSLFYCSSQMPRILAEDVLITSLISSYFSSVVLMYFLIYYGLFVHCNNCNPQSNKRSGFTPIFLSAWFIGKHMSPPYKPY